MYNIQANRARFIYTLSYIPETQLRDEENPPNINTNNNTSGNKRNNVRRKNRKVNPYGLETKFVNETVALKSFDDNKGKNIPINQNNTESKGGNQHQDHIDVTCTLAEPLLVIPREGLNKNERRCMARESSAIIESSLDNVAVNERGNIKPQCKLKTNYYLTKVARSDEKIRYTETDMYSLVRTVLFMYCYQISPQESLNEIINTGNITYDYNLIPHNLQLLTLKNAVELLNQLFGDNFANVVSRMVIKCIDEYNYSWRLYPYNSKILFPSALDFIKLARFMNITTFKYSKATQLMLNNSLDHKIPLQSNIKILK